MDFTSDFADSVPDPALTSQWLVRFPNSTNAYSSIPEEMTTPFTKVPAKARHGGGTNTYFPDFNDIGTISITFYETKDYDCLKWITEWRKKVVNPDDGSYGLPNDYKVTITVELYSFEEGDDTPKITYELEGCWPTEIPDLTGSYDDAEGRVKWAIPFSVDSAKIATT